MQKFLPRCTSPLLYEGVLYVVKEGGILTALNTKTGEILKQGRLKGALDDYYASPVGAAGKVFLLSQQGKATVIRAGADWDILASNDLEDENLRDACDRRRQALHSNSTDTLLLCRKHVRNCTRLLQKGNVRRRAALIVPELLAKTGSEQPIFDPHADLGTNHKQQCG